MIILYSDWHIVSSQDMTAMLIWDFAVRSLQSRRRVDVSSHDGEIWYISLGCHSKCHRVGGLNNRKLVFSQFWRLGIKIRVPAWSNGQGLVRTLTLLSWEQLSLCCVLTWSKL